MTEPAIGTTMAVATVPAANPPPAPTMGAGLAEGTVTTAMSTTLDGRV